MFDKWKVFLVQLALLINQVHPQSIVNTESSEEYLRKVMKELKQMKQSLTTHPVYLPNNNAYLFAGKRHLNTNSNSLRLSTHRNSDQKQQIISEPLKVSTVNSPYYEIPGPVRVPNGLTTFTKNPLSVIYKNAVENGNTINISSLKSVFELLPTTLGDSNNQIGNGKQPTYGYYFYPLKSFTNDIRNNNGLSALADAQTESTTNEFHESQKQMIINPLFMAISSFLGMALVFMLGVLIMPRLLPDFKSRFVHDELLDLTKTVSDAIETYNKTTTMRPKTHYPETIIGIKTKPHVNTSVKRRFKIKKKTSK